MPLPRYLLDQYGDGQDGGIPLDGPPLRRGIDLGQSDPAQFDPSYLPDADLGIDAPQLDQTQDPGFDATPLDMFLERLGAGGVPQGLQHPQGFFQGLVGGVAQGAVGRGQRVSERRKKFETAQVARTIEREKANQQATRDYQQARGTALRDRIKDERTNARDQARYERDNPIVTPEMAAAQPELGRLVGQSVPREWLKPETAAEIERGKRQDAQAARMEAAAVRGEAANQRGEAANVRAAQQALVGNTSKLVDDYRLDPAVKGYQQVRSNLAGAEASAKLKNGFGDRAMIFAYMRALEPENPNAVREGEFASARQGAGAFESIKNLPNYYFNGNNLSDKGRAELLKTMRTLLKARRKNFDETNQRFRGRAKAYGADPSLVVTDFPEDVQDPGAFVVPDGGAGGTAPRSRVTTPSVADFVRRR